MTSESRMHPHTLKDVPRQHNSTHDDDADTDDGFLDDCMHFHSSSQASASPSSRGVQPRECPTPVENGSFEAKHAISDSMHDRTEDLTAANRDIFAKLGDESSAAKQLFAWTNDLPNDLEGEYFFDDTSDESIDLLPSSDESIDPPLQPDEKDGTHLVGLSTPVASRFYTHEVFANAPLALHRFRLLDSPSANLSVQEDFADNLPDEHCSSKLQTPSKASSATRTVSDTSLEGMKDSGTYLQVGEQMLQASRLEASNEGGLGGPEHSAHTDRLTITPQRLWRAHSRHEDADFLQDKASSNNNDQHGKGDLPSANLRFYPHFDYLGLQQDCNEQASWLPCSLKDSLKNPRDTPAHDALASNLSSSYDHFSSPPQSPTLRSAAAVALPQSEMIGTRPWQPFAKRPQALRGHTHVHQPYFKAAVPSLKRKLPPLPLCNTKAYHANQTQPVGDDSNSFASSSPSTSSTSTPKRRRIIAKLAPRKPESKVEDRESETATAGNSKESDEQGAAACILLSLGRKSNNEEFEEVLACKATDRTMRAVRRMTHATREARKCHAPKSQLARPHKQKPVNAQKASITASSTKAVEETTPVAFKDLDGHIKAEMRHFSPDLPVLRERFPLWYRKFRVSSALGSHWHPKVFKAGAPVDCSCATVVKWDTLAHRGAKKLGIWKDPEDPLDLYSARWMRGVGRDKEAVCPICYEEQDGRALYLKSKTSQYNYHLINQHGISPHTKQPIDPPIAFRTVSVNKAAIHERKHMLQGLCHACKGWINLESVKDGDVKVPEIYWWKHSSQCHRKTSASLCSGGVFVEDALYKRVVEVMSMSD